MLQTFHKSMSWPAADVEGHSGHWTEVFHLMAGALSYEQIATVGRILLTNSATVTSHTMLPQGNLLVQDPNSSSSTM